MTTRFIAPLGLGIAALALAVSTTSAQHRDHAHGHPAAAKIKNPVAPNAASIARGRALFEQHCADCHGADGKGGGKKGEGLVERPSDLTDAQWEHGSTDGEIFAVIRDGAGPKSEMEGFAKKIPARQIWDVVNFVRSLNQESRIQNRE